MDRRALRFGIRGTLLGCLALLMIFMGYATVGEALVIAGTIIILDFIVMWLSVKFAERRIADGEKDSQRLT